MKLSKAGIDLAKNVHQLHGVDRSGKTVWKRRLKRHHKSDAKDAEAICEAMSRPSMRFVTVKRVEQQDIQATHRIRTELMTQRTARANRIRRLVAEYRLVAPNHLSSLRSAIPCWLEDAENGLTGDFRALLQGVWTDLLLLDDRIGEMDQTIKRLADNNDDCVRYCTHGLGYAAP